MPGRRDGGLQPQDLVVTICGAHVRRPGQEVWSGGMVEILREFGFSSEAARAALARLVTRGFMHRVKRGRRVGYTLTERAQELLAEGDRRIYSYGRRGAPGTEAWTLLWHVVPEDRRVERARLASQLRFLGFGSVQDATWLAARDRELEVRQLVRSLGVERYSTVLVARPSGDSASALLLSDAWDFAAVERAFDAYLEDFGAPAAPLDDGAAFMLRMRALHRFRALPSIDPEFPDTLVRLEARRTAVVDAFDAILAGFAEPAERYFLATALAPAE